MVALPAKKTMHVNFLYILSTFMHHNW